MIRHENKKDILAGSCSLFQLSADHVGEDPAAFLYSPFFIFVFQYPFINSTQLAGVPRFIRPAVPYRLSPGWMRKTVRPLPLFCARLFLLSYFAPRLGESPIKVTCTQSITGRGPVNCFLTEMFSGPWFLFTTFFFTIFWDSCLHDFMKAFCRPRVDI